MLQALIFLNGELQEGAAIDAALERASQNPRLIIGVDGGLRHVYQLGLIPNVVIGDMDSVSAEHLERARRSGAKILIYPTHKDETDLELALQVAIQHDCQYMCLIGAVGNRLDQTLSNVQLLATAGLHGRTVRIAAGKQTCWLAYPGEAVIHGAIGDTLSLIPMSPEVKNITTEALEYPLKTESLHFGFARGVSNVFLSNTARIHFSEGLLFIVHTHGKAD